MRSFQNALSILWTPRAVVFYSNKGKFKCNILWRRCDSKKSPSRENILSTFARCNNRRTSNNLCQPKCCFTYMFIPCNSEIFILNIHFIQLIIFILHGKEKIKLAVLGPQTNRKDAIQDVFVKHFAPNGNESPNKLFLAPRSKPRSRDHCPCCQSKKNHKWNMHGKYEVSIDLTV